MKKTGELLKKAREEKGLSIQEIGLSLKINSKILRAIEEGDTTQLPAKTFLRGFVQSYASYLRMNVDEILTLFSEEMGSTKPQTQVDPNKTQIKEASEKPAPASASSGVIKPIKSLPSAEESAPALGSLNRNTNTKTIFISAVLLILVALISITKKIVDKYQKESVVEEVQIKTPIEEKQPTTADAVETAPAEKVAPQLPTPPSEKAKEDSAESTKPALPIPAVTAASALSPSTSKLNMSVSEPAIQKSATTVAEKNKKPEIKPEVKPQQAETKVEVKPTIDKTNSNTDTTTPATVVKEEKKPAKNLELIIEALDTVEVEFSSPNGQPEKITLNAEQVHRFKSNSKINLSVSNGGAVNVILNGRDLGVPGSLGKPVKLSY